MGNSKSNETLQAVPAQLYMAFFEGNPDGERIMQELSVHFYDRIAPPDPNKALFMEGQRSVILFILKKIQEGKQ